MKFVNSLFYTTRKCNLSCSYCKIKDNNFKNELPLEEKIHAIRIMNKLSGFIILFGGEPMVLGNDLDKIVKVCKDENIPYAITSNSTLLTKERAKQLVATGLKNWSVSVDTLDRKGSHIEAKSNKGLKDLLMLKKMGVPDLHATITVTRKNLDEVVSIVEFLNKNGIWSEVTALHYSKGNYYDFASPKEEMKDMILDENDLPKVKEVMLKLKKMKIEGAMIHNETSFFDDFTKYYTNLNWRCKEISNLVVDADGRMRTCLHYNRGSRFTIFDLEDPKKLNEFIEEQKEEIKHCNGCFWDCRWQAEYWISKDIEKGVRTFQHQ
jgi:MoaA/NifB/PqqE/SkfB family radical SAM enzyme